MNFDWISESLLWSIAIAATCSLSCALLGCLLVLKRMSLLGDAINHGILPGIVLGVMIVGQVTSFYLFLGAMLFGLLTAVLAQSLYAFGRVSEDASLGVVFTSFFALGVLLISAFFRGAHLDLDCVFLGNLDGVAAYRPLSVLPTQLLALACTLAFLVLLWKELKLAIFDPDLASALGFNANLLHYLLIALVAGVAVSAFEAVGSILVLAMLIVPGATAQMLTDRLKLLFVWAGVVAVSSSIIGCVLAHRLNVSSAGMLSVVAGAEFVLAVVLAPRHGLVANLVRRGRLMLRIAGEDVLAALYRAEEKDVTPGSLTQPEHGFAPLTVRLALWRLRHKGWIESRDGAGWRLTDPGRARAREVVRAHRLWEAYLDRNFELPLDHLHGPATLMEHFIGPEMQGRLAEELELPERDPHGQAIPEDPR